MSSLKKRSPVWQYFDISSDNNKFAICLLCGVQISRGGEGKKAGTSSMSNHLKTKHSENLKAINQDKAAEVSSPLIAVDVIAIDAVPGTSTSLVSTEKQLSLSESLKRKLVWDVNDPKTEKYNYLITEMIALDNESLSVVERIGFSRLLQQALPHYEIPSSTLISQKIVPDIYNRIYEKIKRNISNAPAVSVTSDIWTCLHKNASFLSFTAHWLSPEFQLQHGVLAMKSFPGSHTGENIEKELNRIAARWDIDQNKIHLFIHNSGANMVEGVRVTEYDSARCFIHLLQRVVTESLKIQPEVDETIATGRHLVTHFNNSGLAQEKLLAIQKELGLPEHQLVQDINTRWNSTFYMAERLLEQRRAISLYVADHDALTNLSPQQWCLIEQYIKLLKPFEEITKVTISGLSCISEVIPHVAALKKYLDKDETAQMTPDLPHMRASLKAEIESRFSSIRQDPNYLIATFLDPRFKTNYLSSLETEIARQKILLEYINMPRDKPSDSGSSSPSPTVAKRNRADETGSSDIFEAHFTFWDCFNEIANENESQSQDQEIKAVTSEIEYYLNTVRIDHGSDPYIWWSANSKQYPNLTKFTRIYLSAPCSSVYSERLFCEPGLVYENKRNYSLPLNAEKLVFIQHNLPLVNFEY